MSLKSRLKKRARKAVAQFTSIGKHASQYAKKAGRMITGLGARSQAAGDMAGLGGKVDPRKIGGARTAGAGTLYTKEEYE